MCHKIQSDENLKTFAKLSGSKQDPSWPEWSPDRFAVAGLLPAVQCPHTQPEPATLHYWSPVPKYGWRAASRHGVVVVVDDAASDRPAAAQTAAQLRSTRAQTMAAARAGHLSSSFAKQLWAEFG